MAFDDGYTYSPDGKNLKAIPSGTVHMIVKGEVERLGDSVTRAAQTTLKTVTFLSPSNLKYLDQATFKDCKLIEEIDFRNCTNLERILSETFTNCTSLKSVLFPDSLIAFDTRCFVDTKIEQFTVTPNLTYIGIQSFYNVQTLTHIDFSRGYNFKIFCNKCLEGTNIKSLDLRNCTKINQLEDECFSNCHSLECVYFPCLTSNINIGSLCFFNCTSLENVYFSKCSHVLKVPASMFSYCHKLILPYGLSYSIPVTCNKKNTISTHLSITAILLFLKGVLFLCFF